MPTAAGNMSAANAPCRTRKKTIHASAILRSASAPQNAEAAANPMTPTTTIRRRPSTSPSRPPNANSAASESR